MKLRLSQSLRAAILATFAVLSPLSLSFATASGADTSDGFWLKSPREIKWDPNWDLWKEVDWGVEAYNPELYPDCFENGEIRVRVVNHSGGGWIPLKGLYYPYSVTVPVHDPNNPDATHEVQAYAMAMHGYSDPNAIISIYNTAAGGYALMDPYKHLQEDFPDGQRNYSIYLDISGTFEAVAGGDVYYHGGNWGTVDTEGTNTISSNRFITIRESANVDYGDGARVERTSVGLVSAFNITSHISPPATITTTPSYPVVLRGDSYISVYTSGIMDSVVGRTVTETSTCFGDSHIFIYNVLNQNALTNVHIVEENVPSIMWSSGDVHRNNWVGGSQGCVTGGSYDARDAEASLPDVDITGNSWVVVDLQRTASTATFAKSIAGGSSHTVAHKQTGDAAVFITNAGGVVTNAGGVVTNVGGVEGFSAPVAGQSIFHNSAEWIGNSAVVIENSPTKFMSTVAGSNYEELMYNYLGANVIMRAGNAEPRNPLTPYVNKLNTSLDKLKANYTALKNKWEGGGAGGADEPANPEAATHSVSAVYIDQASDKAVFSKAVVGSNALYTVEQYVANTDTGYYTDLNLDYNADSTYYVTKDGDRPTYPPFLAGTNGMWSVGNMSVSYVREEGSRSIVWIEGGTYQDLVVAGDYLYDTDNVEGAIYQPDPTRRWYVRHYSFRSSIGSTYMHIGGGTFNNQVQGGTYVYAQNYGGYYLQVIGAEPKPQLLVVSMRVKDINMELLGGTYGTKGRTAVLGGFDVTDTITEIDKPGQCLTSIVDAHVGSIYIQMGALDENGARIGEGVTVNGEIIGGSHIKACDSLPALPALPGQPYERRGQPFAIRQGSIWLRLLNGQFLGNVYGAGFYDSQSGKYASITAPIYTESVNIELSNQAEFGKIAIYSSYKMSISDSSATPNLSVVEGDAKLSFTSAGVYSNLTKVEFAYFDVVDVTEPTGYVTLYQPLQILFEGVGADGRKRGKGTLALANVPSSNVSSFTVENGTLVLPANSNSYETGMIACKMTVQKEAALDISGGSCGIRGDVTLEGNSSLEVAASQSPTRVTSIEWGRETDGSAKINVVSNVIPTDEYNVRLFDGLTVDKVSVFGQSLKPIAELGLSEKDLAELLGLDGTQELGEVYGLRAEDCVNLQSGGKDVSMDNAYLVLRNGVLSLATKIGREITWTGGNGDSWNYVTPLFVVGAKAEEALFNDNDTVRFVGKGGTMEVNLDPSDSHAADPVAHPATNNHTLKPYSIIVGADREEGDDTVPPPPSTIVFSSLDEACKLDVEGSITVQNNSKLIVEASAGLATHADSTFIEVRDDTSSLTVYSDQVDIYTLSNLGKVDVSGSMSVTNRVTSLGSLTVGKDLTLGAGATSTYAQFGDLIVAGILKFEEPNTVAISGSADIGSVQGGTLVITDGAADAAGAGRSATFSMESRAAADGVTLRHDSTLKALQGAGNLTVVDRATLTLKAPSNIGNLFAVNKNAEGCTVVLHDRLHVDGTLEANKVEFTTIGNGVIAEKVVKAETLGCELFYADDNSVKDIHFVYNGAVYTLVEGETVTGELQINDAKESWIKNGRFSYHAYVESNTIKIGVSNAFPNYYADFATTQNGKAGAASLDSLFNREIMGQIAGNKNALASVIIAMDNMVAADNAAGADTLAAAAAGASNAALGCAFSDDVHRQLKAIRNRTTTMGCAECETHENIPTFNAWINAEGNYNKLDSDGTFAGYTLSSWGGTIGADVDFSGHLTAGLAVTALYGDYSGDGADTTDGDLDTQYLTLFARYSARAWVHTFVATVGRADVSIERTVTAEGVAYSNKADTDGTGFGFMYEVGRVFAINEDSTACIEPIVNFTLLKSTVGGFTETGTDAAVETGDMEMTKFIIGAGARMQGVVGATVYNRTSILEGRALIKANLGDNSCETENRFVIGGIDGSYESAEQGSVGLELGVGITVPVGGEGSSVFADFSADINAGYSNVNGTIGYRVNF